MDPEDGTQQAYYKHANFEAIRGQSQAPLGSYPVRPRRGSPVTTELRLKAEKLIFDAIRSAFAQSSIHDDGNPLPISDSLMVSVAQGLEDSFHAISQSNAATYRSALNAANVALRHFSPVGQYLVCAMSEACLYPAQHERCFGIVMSCFNLTNGHLEQKKIEWSHLRFRLSKDYHKHAARAPASENINFNSSKQMQSIHSSVERSLGCGKNEKHLSPSLQNMAPGFVESSQILEPHFSEAPSSSTPSYLNVENYDPRNVGEPLNNRQIRMELAFPDGHAENATPSSQMVQGSTEQLAPDPNDSCKGSRGQKQRKLVHNQPFGDSSDLTPPTESSVLKIDTMSFCQRMRKASFSEMSSCSHFSHIDKEQAYLSLKEQSVNVQGTVSDWVEALRKLNHQKLQRPTRRSFLGSTCSLPYTASANSRASQSQLAAAASFVNMRWNNTYSNGVDMVTGPPRDRLEGAATYRNNTHVRTATTPESLLFEKVPPNPVSSDPLSTSEYMNKNESGHLDEPRTEHGLGASVLFQQGENQNLMVETIPVNDSQNSIDPRPDSRAHEQSHALQNESLSYPQMIDPKDFNTSKVDQQTKDYMDGVDNNGDALESVRVLKRSGISNEQILEDEGTGRAQSTKGSEPTVATLSSERHQLLGSRSSLPIESSEPPDTYVLSTQEPEASSAWSERVADGSMKLSETAGEYNMPQSQLHPATLLHQQSEPKLLYNDYSEGSHQLHSQMPVYDNRGANILNDENTKLRVSMDKSKTHAAAQTSINEEYTKEYGVQQAATMATPAHSQEYEYVLPSTAQPAGQVLLPYGEPGREEQLREEQLGEEPMEEEPLRDENEIDASQLPIAETQILFLARLVGTRHKTAHEELNTRIDAALEMLANALMLRERARDEKTLQVLEKTRALLEEINLKRDSKLRNDANALVVQLENQLKFMQEKLDERSRACDEEINRETNEVASLQDHVRKSQSDIDNWNTSLAKGYAEQIEFIERQIISVEADHEERIRNIIASMNEEYGPGSIRNKRLEAQKEELISMSQLPKLPESSAKLLANKTNIQEDTDDLHNFVSNSSDYSVYRENIKNWEKRFERIRGVSRGFSDLRFACN